MNVNNTELFLYMDDRWVPIEVSADIPFPLTYNIADIRDITKRNTTYSKTLSIPGTKNNNDVLNYLFDIANVSTYNVNRKVRCSIVVDTIPVITDAFFQITDIKSEDNIHFTYECLILGDTDNIVKELEGKFMTDLDVSTLGHTYSNSVVAQSWTDNWSNGYYYGLVDYGYNWDVTDIGPSASTGVRTQDMKPALYVKYLWNKMFSEAGWSYESSFISATSSPWNYMLMLGGANLLQNPTYSYYKSFRVALPAPVTYTLGHFYQHTGYAYPFAPTLQFGYSGTNAAIIAGINPASPVTVAPGPVYDKKRLGGIGFNFFTYSRIPFTDETTYPNGDPSSLYDTSNTTTTGLEYTHPTGGGVVSLGVQLEMIIPATSSLYAANSLSATMSTPQFIIFDAFIFRSTLGITNPSTIVYYPINGVNAGPSNAYGGWAVGAIAGSTFSTITSVAPAYTSNTYARMYPGRTYVKTFNTPLFNQPGAASATNPYAVLQPGEKVWIKLIARPNSFGSSLREIGAGFSFTLGQNSFIYNYVDPTLIEGQPIDPQSMLPKNFKQIDFFTGLIKMFNLYVEPDKNISKRLRIEPRDTYYNTGTERNWTSKVDIDKEVHQQVIAETQARELLLTYKEDKDAYNDNYKQATQEIYGQYKYQIDNDFVKGTQKIEVPFAATPVTYLSGANYNSPDVIILPVIAKNNNGSLVKTDFIPRILFRTTSGVVNIQDPNNYWKFNSVLQATYPYMGHFNDPRNATDDLNFGQTQFLYYNLNNIDNENLFTNYYKKQLEELTDKDSRIITLNMKLTPQDMNDFSFRDRIIIDGISSGTINYFRINKIEYDPTLKGTFKVELLKAKDIPRRTSIPRRRGIQAASKPATAVGVGIELGTGNTTYGTGVVVVGRDNLVLPGAKSTLILGDNNFVAEGNRSTLIVGSNNRSPVGGSNTLILGDNITLLPGQSGLYVNSITTYVNYVDANYDIILNPFSETVTFNWIDGSVDRVRQMGSRTTISLLDAKTDMI